MSPFQTLQDLFARHPELLYATGFILLLSFAGFAYLLYQYVNKKQPAPPAAPKPYRNEEPPVVVQERKPVYTPPKAETQPVVIKPAPRTTPAPPAPASTPKPRPVSSTATPPPAPPKKETQPKVEPAPAPKDPVATAAPQPVATPPPPPAPLPRQPRTPQPVTTVEAGEEAATNEVVRIGYIPNDEWSQAPPYRYPLVQQPKRGSVVRLPHNRRRQLRGYTEQGFQNALQRAFTGLQVSGEAGLPTSAGSRPYEPDIAIIIREGGRNLFIDIEIDEPYAAIRRTPMHCQGYDHLRDTWFTDRGWVVIRFTEKQVHTQPDHCLAHVARVIHSLHPSFVVPARLAALPAPAFEPQWTVLQAQQWEKEKYREQYLGITAFGEQALDAGGNAALEPNEQDRATEAAVQPTAIGVEDQPNPYAANVRNSHPRDRRIRFFPDEHVYLVDGAPMPSVTTAIDACFPVFDAEYWSLYKTGGIASAAANLRDQWEAAGTEAQLLGTALHTSIEQHYHGLSVINNTPEYAQFLRFHQAHPGLRPFRTEWRIFDEVHHLAGTIDLLVANSDGTWDMYDWKRSKKVVNAITRQPIATDSYGKCGIGAFSHIPDTSYNRYCLQQNLYKYILETHYGIRVRNMHLVVMHPDLSDYVVCAVPVMREDAVRVLKRYF